MHPLFIWGFWKLQIIKILLRNVDKIAYIHKKAIIHEGPKLNIPKDAHFCEVELIDFLKDS